MFDLSLSPPPPLPTRPLGSCLGFVRIRRHAVQCIFWQYNQGTCTCTCALYNHPPYVHIYTSSLCIHVYTWLCVLDRVLPRKYLMHRGWAWFGWSLWPHQSFWIPHIKEILKAWGPAMLKGPGENIETLDHSERLNCYYFVQVWDTTSFKCMNTLTGHDGIVLALCALKWVCYVPTCS